MRHLLLVTTGLTASLLAGGPSAGQSQVATNPTGPRLEPVAETRLLMEGLALPNFRGLERILGKKPADAEAWRFARGQALLLAETGNLLMLRPPKSKGQAEWMDRATELRTTSTQLAAAAALQNPDRSRAGLTRVATACNHCHQTFRVKMRITPFAAADAPAGP